MTKKIKFKPQITRVKLNPEQAILVCNCFDTAMIWGDTRSIFPNYVSTLQFCLPGVKLRNQGPEQWVPRYGISQAMS